MGRPLLDPRAGRPGRGTSFAVFFLVEDSLLRVLDPVLQIGGLLRLEHDLFLFDQALPPEVEEAVVEQDHAVLPPGLDRRVDAVRLVLADQVRDRRSDHEHLVGGHEPLVLVVEDDCATGIETGRDQVGEQPGIVGEAEGTVGEE